MRANRSRGTRRRWASAAAVLVTGLALAGASGASGVAAAAPRPASATAPGTISTVAGGVGGPGRATKVSVDACGVLPAGGGLYIGGGLAVRKVSPAGLLTTPAGTNSPGPLGDGAPATLAGLGQTCGIGMDHSGNLVLAESGMAGRYRIAVVAARTGTFYGQAMIKGDIYSVAGTGKQGAGGSGVPARGTVLGSPEGVTVDRHGNLVIADNGWMSLPPHLISHGALVQVVAATAGTFYGQKMKAGRIYTVAGYNNGTGFSGDGGPATRAALGQFSGQVQTDAAGNLLIADTVNNRVRVVAVKTGTFYGQKMTAGDIYTVAGDGTRGFAGDGGPATRAELYNPQGVAADAAGNLVIGDSTNGRVRVVAVKTGTFYGQPMTAGDIYTVAGGGSAPLTISPGFLAVDGAGNVVVAGASRAQVLAARTGTFYGQKMTAGHVYTVAGNGTFGYNGAGGFSGDGGPATRAELNGPEGLAVDGAGNVVVDDGSNYRIRVVAARAGTYFGTAMKAGDIYTVAGDGTAGLSGDGGPATKAEISLAGGVALDAAGNLLIADTINEEIRVVAARSGTFYGQAMNAGDIYTVAGDGTHGYSGDGGPATKARLAIPHDVTVDAAGNLVITDSGNERVRVVAAKTGTFYGQAMTAGDIYTVAGDGTLGFSGDGGPATKAKLDFPVGATVDAAGNLVITDSYNCRVRVVAVKTGTFYGQAMTAGDIYTVAGDGTPGFSGDGGPAAKAEVLQPQGVTVDAAGNLVIGDTGNYRVRVVAAKTGTFYGQAMTAGDIYTVAGDGTPGFSGDGGPATRAGLAGPTYLALDRAGNLLIADTGANRVRMVTG